MPTLGARLLHGSVRVADTLHLRWVLRGVVRRLPPSLRVRLSKAQVQLGYLQGLTLVPEDAVEASYRAALELMRPELDRPGAAYLEFGVYIGTTMACMHRAAAGRSGTRPRLIGFDSFQGMPEGVEHEDDGRWRTGDLYSDIALTRANLAKQGVALEDIELIAGWFEDTLTETTRSRLGVACAPIVMVDCVIASATTVALSFLTPLIRDRSLVYFDDWAIVDLGDPSLGERAAFEAWLAEHPELTAEEQPALQYSEDARAFLVSRRTG
jgi:O-methyltransferase